MAGRQRLRASGGQARGTGSPDPVGQWWMQWWVWHPGQWGRCTDHADITCQGVRSCSGQTQAAPAPKLGQPEEQLRVSLIPVPPVSSKSLSGDPLLQGPGSPASASGRAAVREQASHLSPRVAVICHMPGTVLGSGGHRVKQNQAWLLLLQSSQSWGTQALSRKPQQHGGTAA